MATTKRKPAAKKAPAKKPVAKKVVAKKTMAKKAAVKKTAAKRPAVRATSVSRRRPFITRNDEYTQLTWVLICVWLVLIAIFLGTVVGQL